MRIIFMGTPEFSVPSLDLLCQKGWVVGVVTAADKPAGRGQLPTPSPVKLYAQKHHIPTLQPLNLKDPSFLEELSAFSADLFVVVAFRMLPKVVWAMPPKGTINLHASLLPDYRGAAPINWAIINGEKITGLTTFFIEEQIDTGQIIAQVPIPIHDEYNAGDLHDIMMEEGAKLLLKTVENIINGTFTTSPQDSLKIKHLAPKIFPNDCQIRWEQPALKIRDFIRGLAPYPGAWANLEGQKFKIYSASIADIENIENKDYKPGKLLIGQNQMYVKALDHWLRLIEVQLAGKKKMPASDFLKVIALTHRKKLFIYNSGIALQINLY